MNSDFCEKYAMLPRDGIVLCAVSGGKDSMYLLENLRELAPACGFELRCAHFDHRLRGEESRRDRDFVVDWCRKRGIPCYVGSADVSRAALESGLGIEEAARKLRYEFLERTADEIGAVRIATAHTADDNAETVLMNLARGSGLKGLCGIPPVRGRIIRPMLRVTSAEVTAYLEEKGIPHVEDSTNAGDEYARNRIRHRVVPELRALNGSFDTVLTRGTELLREDEDYLSSLADGFIEEKRRGNSLPAAELAALPGPVSSRVLRKMIPGELSSAHIEALTALASGGDSHACAFVPGMRVIREYDRLVFGAAVPKRIEKRALDLCGITEIPEAGLEISCLFIEKCQEINNSLNIFFFQSDSICGNITIMSRPDGEKIRLAGRKCTKSLKKLFSEAKLNGEGRDLVPVLCDEKGVIAVYGFGIAERCVPSAGDSVIRTEIKTLGK